MIDLVVAWTPDLRARYAKLCEYYRWLPEVSEAEQFRMAYGSLYRPAYVYGRGRSGGGELPAPWLALPSAEVDAWRARNLDERWATSEKTARALAWLAREFSGRDRAEPQ